MNWGRWRLLTSEHLNLTLADLRAMTFDDYHQAHCVLDAFEAMALDARAEVDMQRAVRGSR